VLPTDVDVLRQDINAENVSARTGRKQLSKSDPFAAAEIGDVAVASRQEREGEPVAEVPVDSPQSAFRVLSALVDSVRSGVFFVDRHVFESNL